MKTIITKKHLKLPERRQDSRKGDNGRVLVIGGSPEYIGAPALAGIAALRSGADSVVVAAPSKTAWAINALSPDLVTRKLAGERLSIDHAEELEKQAEQIDCVVLGMGVAEEPESMRLLERLSRAIHAPKVLDAAALFAFEPATLTNAVLLPNVNEFKRLSSSIDSTVLVKRENIIIEKGPRTRIHTAERIYENRTGNAGMTKAGTGDVLAGLVAGFIAQSHDPLQSALNAVYVLGKVGDALLQKKGGPFYLASDLAEEIRRFSEAL